MTVCIDCKKDLPIPRDTVCQPCVQKWYLAQKEIALGGSGGSPPRVEDVVRDDPRQGPPAGALGGGNLDYWIGPIEETPRVRARACLYFRPANITFPVGE